MVRQESELGKVEEAPAPVSGLHRMVRQANANAG